MLNEQVRLFREVLEIVKQMLIPYKIKGMKGKRGKEEEKEFDLKYFVHWHDFFFCIRFNVVLIHYKCVCVYLHTLIII